MLRNARVWAYATGGWLLVAGGLQWAAHVWGVAGEHAMIGQREFAMDAMKQAFSLAPLQPSLWRSYRMLSASLGLFFVYGGMVPILLAWARVSAPALAGMALFGTVFWTLAFALYAFADPVLLPLVTAAVAVPLHALVWLTATYESPGARP